MKTEITTLINTSQNSKYTKVGCNPTQAWWKSAWEAARQAAIGKQVGLVAISTDGSHVVFQVNGDSSKSIKVTI